MSRHPVGTRPVATRRPLRVGALALAALMLVTACTTGAPMGGGLTASRFRPRVSRDSPEPWALEAEAEADDGSQGEAIFAKLPTDFASVQVSDAEFSAAMTTLWLNMPLRLAASRAPVLESKTSAVGSPGLTQTSGACPVVSAANMSAVGWRWLPRP